MNSEANDQESRRFSPQVKELGEDLDIAIREFLERHPRTRDRRIRQALRLAERNVGGKWERRFVGALALLAAFLVGAGLGVVFG